MHSRQLKINEHHSHLCRDSHKHEGNGSVQTWAGMRSGFLGRLMGGESMNMNEKDEIELHELDESSEWNKGSKYTKKNLITSSVGLRWRTSVLGMPVGKVCVNARV